MANTKAPSNTTPNYFKLAEISITINSEIIALFHYYN